MATATSSYLEQISSPVQAASGPERGGAPLREIGIVLAVSLALRLPYFRGRFFPLNDGGMFAQIIDDLRAAHFHLPTHTTYNFLHIPLSYPPLGFYLGALCTLLPGQNTVSVLTWLPLCLNLLCGVLAYFIAREMYPSRFHACLAACCYVAIGRSSEWLIMGGGLTRASGLICAELAVLLFLRSRSQHSLRLTVWAGFWAGMAALFHLEGGIFAALSLTVLSLLLPPRRRNVQRLFLSGAVAVAVVTPWLFWVYTHLGFGPLLDAGHTGGTYGMVSVYIMALMVAAVILAVAARFPYILWLAVIPLVMRRSAATYGALVGGLSMVWFANAILAMVRPGAGTERWRRPALAALAFGLAISIGGIPAIHSDRLEDLTHNSRAQLSPAELDGMRAAARLTPPNAKFFVFNQRFGAWYVDMFAEWFPYFAQRQCVNTVQGREWLPEREFEAAVKREAAIAISGSPRVAMGLVEDLKPDYILIAQPLDANQTWLAQVLRAYAGSPPIYQNSEVSLYQVKRASR